MHQIQQYGAIYLWPVVSNDRLLQGFVMNMQPSEAEVGFDLRLPPTEDIEQIKRRVKEEWAPAHKNLTYQVKKLVSPSFPYLPYLKLNQVLHSLKSLLVIQLTQKGPVTDVAGRPIFTATDESNPWWPIFEKAITSAGGKLSKPEILSSTTDSRFVRQLGIPALGFSPMTNTPILLHDHNEVTETRPLPLSFPCPCPECGAQNQC
jgi:amidohydrolase/aminoacylase